MISADEALHRIFSLLPRLTSSVTVPLLEANGRVLARKVRAKRSQPPFAAAMMDGFALRDEDAKRGVRFRIIGESVAGKGFTGPLHSGEAVRIFTGAPLPEGADRVVTQESTEFKRHEMTIIDEVSRHDNYYIRDEGADFKAGAEVAAGQIITPERVALLAAMNVDKVDVIRRPRISIIPTGDELQMPGRDTIGEHEIVSSSGFGLAAILANAGAGPRILPIARDRESSLRSALEAASDSDLIVTLGGASVGDHDQVVPVARKLGMTLACQQVAMRPGKPLFAGQLFGKPLIGLPGNPVSTLVCGHLFLVPAVAAMLGLGERPRRRKTATLDSAVQANGERQHFMRAAWHNGQLKIFSRQDSSLISVMAAADALIDRPAHDSPRQAGEKISYIDVNFSLFTLREQV